MKRYLLAYEKSEYLIRLRISIHPLESVDVFFAHVLGGPRLIRAEKTLISLRASAQADLSLRCSRDKVSFQLTFSL